jgi:hypothetical protein
MQGATDGVPVWMTPIVSHRPQHVRNMVLVIGCALSAVNGERRAAL